MKILAIDTSASACSIAISIDDTIYAVHHVAPMEQAQKILPLIQIQLDDAKIKLNQLDAIAFGCGPGSFTGVRIAASVVQGLAFATGLPIIKISSLAAVAQAAYQDLGWAKILVGMDARIQEVYWGAYQVNPEGLVELIGTEIVCPPQDVSLPLGTDWYGVGSAWDVYQTELLTRLPFKPLAQDATRLPMASAILQLAKEAYLRKAFTPLDQAMPVYLRDNVAIKQKDKS